MTPAQLAQQILDRIAADPDAFEPGLHGFATVNSHAIWPDDEIDGDDTAMGVTGWACYLSGWRLSTDDMGVAWAFVEDWEQRRNPIDVAVELLGLDSLAPLKERDRDAAIASLRRVADSGSRFCVACGEQFATSALLDTHQDETSHEMHGK